MHVEVKLSDSNEFGKDVIIFSADMSSSVHADNEKNLGKGPMQG